MSIVHPDPSPSSRVEARPEREAVARLIEPRAFEKSEGGWQWRYRDALTVQSAALAKADAILTLLADRTSDEEKANLKGSV